MRYPTVLLVISVDILRIVIVATKPVFCSLLDRVERKIDYVKQSVRDTAGITKVAKVLIHWPNHKIRVKCPALLDL